MLGQEVPIPSQLEPAGAPCNPDPQPGSAWTHLMGFELGEAKRASSELGLPSRHTSGSGSKHGGVGGSEQVFNSDVPAAVSAEP